MTRPSNYGKVTHNKEATDSVVYLFVLLTDNLNMREVLVAHTDDEQDTYEWVGYASEVKHQNKFLVPKIPGGVAKL
jgi:hypothetical protein